MKKTLAVQTRGRSGEIDPTGFLWDSGKTKSMNRNLVISVQLGIETLGNKIPPGSGGGGGVRLLKEWYEEAGLWLLEPRGKAARGEWRHFGKRDNEQPEREADILG